MQSNLKMKLIVRSHQSEYTSVKTLQARVEFEPILFKLAANIGVYVLLSYNKVISWNSHDGLLNRRSYELDSIAHVSFVWHSHQLITVK